MDCIKIICLYLEKYISDKQFENIFFDYMEDFQNVLEEDICLDILWTNFERKEENITLKTKLQNYIVHNYKSMYDGISDAYVENMIDSDENNTVVEILKKKYKKADKVIIDCQSIDTQLELLDSVKKALKYPRFCGNNWDAVEDLIYDVIFPETLLFDNWNIIEEKLPEDAVVLKKILSKVCCNSCRIIYAEKELY